MTERVVIGWDPGIAKCGFGVISRAPRGLTWLEVGHVESPTAWTEIRRLRHIYREAVRLCRDHRPVLFVIEDQSGVSAAARENQKRVLEAARQGREIKSFGFNANNDAVTEVVGVLKAVAFQYGIPVLEVQPRSAKVAVLGAGGGKATKQQMITVIQRIFRDIGEISEHGADGLAVAIAGERATFLGAKQAG